MTSIQISTTLVSNMTAANNGSTTTLPAAAAGLELPHSFRTLSISSINVICIYALLFIIGGWGNLSVFSSICRRRHSGKLKWRITILILNLSLADLIVIGIVIPSEIAWRATISWAGGPVLCKIVQFGRAFGLYLSSMVLICISLDRFVALVYPLRMVVNSSRRVKGMLWIAWICAGICAAPQAIVFDVQRHPKYPTFQQCVTYGFLRTQQQELIYNLFSVIVMYFLPLVVIVLTYSMILWKIQKSKESQRKQSAASSSYATPNGSNKMHGHGHCGNGMGIGGGGGGNGNNSCLSTRTPSLASSSTLGQKQQVPEMVSKQDLVITCSSDGKLILQHRSSGSSVTTTTALNGHSMTQAAAAAPMMFNANAEPNNGLVHHHHPQQQQHQQQRSKENAVEMMARAKWKILRLTCIIILLFLLCWTPYVVMLLWYMFDRSSAKQVHSGIQDILFMMAVANSCVNPFVYGNYTTQSSSRRRSGNKSPPAAAAADNNNRRRRRTGSRGSGSRRHGSSCSSWLCCLSSGGGLRDSCSSIFDISSCFDCLRKSFCCGVMCLLGLTGLGRCSCFASSNNSGGDCDSRRNSSDAREAANDDSSASSKNSERKYMKAHHRSSHQNNNYRYHPGKVQKQHFPVTSVI